MKIEDLLKLKIDIKTRNNIAYQEMALLLDKPEFLQLLPNLRETYKIKELSPLKDYKSFLSWWIPEYLEKKVKINLKKYKRINEFKKLFPEQFNFIKDGFISDLQGNLILESNLICFEFKKPLFFTDIIPQAIICGVVDDTYYTATKATVIDFLEMGPWEFHIPQAAILISPTSRYEDVKEAFRNARKFIKTDKRLSYYQPRIDTVNNIRKYRYWYWERLKGKKLKKISEE